MYENIFKFITVIFFHSDKCFIVTNDEFELSEEIQSKLIQTGNTISDTYIFEAASVTITKLILKTHARLNEWMQDHKEFTIELLDDFLAEY